MSLPKLSPQQIKSLNEILEQARWIEVQILKHNFPSPQVAQLKSTLMALSDLPKISAIAEHLNEKMSPRHFQNFMVPIERLLDRNLRDDQFLTTSIDRPAATVTRRNVFFVLDNLRSAFNVGSLFRLADCVGAGKIYLSGYTASPADVESVAKTSLGASSVVEFSSTDNLLTLISDLRKQGIRTVALETGRNTESLFGKPLLGPTAFIVGNERFGLDFEILNAVDEVRSIPTYGMKNSLNVANALSVAAFEWSRQNP